MALTLTADDVRSEPSCGRAGFRCVGCGGGEGGPRPIFAADGPNLPFDLFRCAGCSLVQQHPRALGAALAEQYDADYYVFQEDEPRRWARAVQQYVIHLLPLEGRVAGARLLDVGCALGHLAALARSRGWRVVGIDISAAAVSRAAAAFDLEVRAGPLARHAATLPRFDAVFLGDVIEHAADPAAMLRQVREGLAPGGLVCIDTPNFASRWRRFGGRRWLGFNPYHVNLFDAGSLGALLARCGFAVVRTGSYTHYRYADWSARPEVAPRVNWLPRMVAWRVTAMLRRLTGRGVWRRLRLVPPRTLEDATVMVEALCGAALPTTARKSTCLPAALPREGMAPGMAPGGALPITARKSTCLPAAAPREGMAPGMAPGAGNDSPGSRCETLDIPRSEGQGLAGFSHQRGGVDLQRLHRDNLVAWAVRN